MATETRTFESVDNSPEAQAANRAYFESKGETYEVKGGASETTKTPASQQTPPAPGAAPAADADEAELDALEEQLVRQASAAPGSASPDGKKESSVARARRERRELKAENERLLAELATAKAAAKPTPPETPPASGTPAAAAAPASAAAEAGAPAAETFSEPEPVMPKYEDFANEDDQLLAFNTALAQHTKDWGRWDRKRERFEEKAADAAAQRKTQADQQQNERLTALNARLAEVRGEFPDFDTVLQQGNVLSPALSAASTFVPGGLKAAYLLAKDPAKLKAFNEQTAATRKVNGQDVPTQDAYDLALYLLGQIAGPSASAPAPSASPAPTGSIPSAPTPPREEPPAPRPARGRAADEPRRTDLSGDARRDRLAAELAQGSLT